MDVAVHRVSLAHPRLRAAAPAALDPRGARVVIGGEAENAPASPIVPSSRSLFGPRGAAITSGGALWIADTGHHRLLGWSRLPPHDDAPADWLIGQPDFASEGRNSCALPSARSFNVPTGVCDCGGGLAVADAWNHRVLVWREAPRSSHQPADCVLGQADFGGAEINRGSDRPSADSLYWPYGVYWDGRALWVADTGNRRVLRWNAMPERSGQPADLVLGQPDFMHRDENAGDDVGPASLRWPHAIAHWHGRFCVADAGNNRIAIWDRTPEHDFAACDRVIGQCDAHRVDHNRGEYWPTAESLNMPYGIVVHRDRLLIADTANSRVLRFDAPDHAAADALAGQRGFADKGDNRWQPTARDSMCWPYALAVHGDTCLVVDSGNNRVLLWDIAS